MTSFRQTNLSTWREILSELFCKRENWKSERLNNFPEARHQINVRARIQSLSGSKVYGFSWVGYLLLDNSFWYEVWIPPAMSPSYPLPILLPFGTQEKGKRRNSSQSIQCSFMGSSFWCSIYVCFLLPSTFNSLGSKFHILWTFGHSSCRLAHNIWVIGSDDIVCCCNIEWQKDGSRKPQDLRRTGRGYIGVTLNSPAENRISPSEVHNISSLRIIGTWTKEVGGPDVGSGKPGAEWSQPVCL